MLQFSANLSMLFTELPLVQRFHAARQAGFSAVEIQFPYELPVADLQRLLQDNQLKLVLINLPAGDLMRGGNGLACVPGREADFRLAVEQALRYAWALEVPAVNVLAGRLAGGVSRDQALDTLQANLQFAVEKLSGVGISTCIEAINCYDIPGFLLNTAEDMRQMLARVAHPSLQMQVDLYHMARMQEDLPTLLQQDWRLIGHIQFADTPGRGAPGSGELPFAHLFKQIAALPYSGYCGAEYNSGKDTPATLGWLTAYRN